MEKIQTAPAVIDEASKLQEVVLSAVKISNTNLPIISNKVSAARAAGSAIKSISDDKMDAYAEKFLVKCRATTAEVDKLRKEITKPMDDYKSAVMTFEKALNDEVIRIKTMRDAYANEKRREKVAAQLLIDKEKNFKIHEAEVKSEMKAALGLGIAKKIEDLETAVAGMFKNCDSVAKVAVLEKGLNIKPSLKEDFYNSLFNVAYNTEIMSMEHFAGLKKRAAEFFDFAKVNAAYIDEANKVISKWRSAIPAKRLELEQIAKATGDKKSELTKAAEQRADKAIGEIKVQAEKKVDAVKLDAETEKQGEIMDANFTAQLQGQEIKEVEGTRKNVSYRIDPKFEKDMLKVSQLIGKVILNVLSEPNNKEGIFARDQSGFVKRDDKTGSPVYVSGVAYWLNMLTSLKYTPQIDGLVRTEELSTIATAKPKK